MNRDELYRAAEEAWGKDAQVMQLIEEMAELTVDLCHSERAAKIMYNLKIAEEVAHVEIMLEQLKLSLGLSEDVCEFRDKSFRRLEFRLGRER